ncbi:hypothetical protein ANANG_G00005980 [Anguilla anguilla]|uniref:Flotillin n=1 Tax=Anguilla anguilla TaxID=7936 RepID=A0A9D3S658_ANGAN|nr:hypothetical protein ANANG_G00005980 [Anguilla anguilla]
MTRADSGPCETANHQLADRRQRLITRPEKGCSLISLSMFYTCGPNEAMVVSGFCRSPPVMIAGGRVFVLPCVQQIQRMTLNTMTLNVKSDKVYTRHGVPISVTGIAQVKIQGQNKEMLAAACQMFMGKTESEITHIALETLEGHQRAIIAHLTVEEIYQDRKKFSEQVFKVASSDLVNMGISVVSYTLKDVHDDQDYLHSLGKARTAQVQRDARIGEAQYKRDAVIREAQAMQEKAGLSLPLIRRPRPCVNSDRDGQSSEGLRAEEVHLRHRGQHQEGGVRDGLSAADHAAGGEDEVRWWGEDHAGGARSRERELEARSEAEKYRLERLAEAERLQLIMEAEAEAESIRVKGEAEAFAVEAKGRADAEQMSKKAEAFHQYKDGAMVDMLLEKLPLIAEEISRPLCATQKLTMVSSGGSEVGAAKLTGEVLEIMTRLPAAVEKLTGVNISQVTGSSTRMG